MEEIYSIFMESTHGNLANKIQGLDREEKWSDLWYIFKPQGFEKTLAEMDSEERENRRKGEKFSLFFLTFFIPRYTMYKNT